jgi:hypothetical protein
MWLEKKLRFTGRMKVGGCGLRDFCTIPTVETSTQSEVIVR